MKLSQVAFYNRKSQAEMEPIQVKINQPYVQVRKRFSSTITQQDKHNVTSKRFRTSSVYQNPVVNTPTCPQNTGTSGNAQISSIFKELELPKSNRASHKMPSQFTIQTKLVQKSNNNDKNSNKTYSDIKTDLYELMLKKNKSRQKYEDIVRQFGNGAELFQVNSPPVYSKKSSDLLELPLGSFPHNNNPYKMGSMAERIPAKSPRRNQEFSPIITKPQKVSFNQKEYETKDLFLLTPDISLQKTPEKKQKEGLFHKNVSNRSTLDSSTAKHLGSTMQKFTTSKAKTEKISLEDFVITKKLGEGKFGQVFRVIHKLTCSLYALKKIKKSAIKTYLMEDQMMMEIKLQLFFNHPNILKVYSVFDDETCVYLLLEYMEQGTLYSQLKKKGVLNEEEASKVMFDVLKGVNYLHENDIAHRDIKPQNIVISNGVCKLCDFGWSAICKDDRRTTMCGTLDYSAPEVLQGKQYSKSIDLWCLGVMTFQLMVGKAPFYHINRKETMKKIVNQKQEQLQFPTTINQKVKNFINNFLSWQPQERISAADSLKDSFITDHNQI